MVAGLVLQCVNVMLDIVQYLLVGDRFAKVNLVLSFSVKSRNNFPIFAGVPPTTCPAQSVGLVRYPTTLAPASRSVTVTAQCADNARVRSGSSLSVRCTSSGSWSGTTPVCECDDGYLPVTVSTGRQVCQSERKHKNSVMQTNIKILFFPSQQLLVRQQQVR